MTQIPRIAVSTTQASVGQTPMDPPIDTKPAISIRGMARSARRRNGMSVDFLSVQGGRPEAQPGTQTGAAGEFELGTLDLRSYAIYVATRARGTEIDRPARGCARRTPADDRLASEQEHCGHPCNDRSP